MSVWLQEMRRHAKLSRRVASVHVDVAERSIVRWEDPEEESLPPADKFLSLVVRYGAVKDLLLLLAKWEKVARPAAGGEAGEGKRHAG